MTHRFVRMMGPRGAARFIRARADELILLDGLTENSALALACERVLDGDPLTLSAPGQVWRRRSGGSGAMALLIVERLSAPPRIRAEDENGSVFELPIGSLAAYEFAFWPAGRTRS
ncbi:hypothetical protein ACFUJR_25830 [Streptomyces sp. NPDC057271]|uniref:hypothetical protein n=1 Tax=unclassified Streptomyces TaxID=2593676 RepID=UPI0036421D4C